MNLQRPHGLYWFVTDTKQVRDAAVFVSLSSSSPTGGLIGDRARSCGAIASPEAYRRACLSKGP